MLRYPCLVLDHDDTVVNSTPTIHYPSFMKTMAVLRPNIQWTLEEFMGYNFDPGFEAMLNQMLALTPEEALYQEKVWKEWCDTHHPDMFAGMDVLLKRYKQAGGIICVVSHSSEEVIRWDYRHHCGFEPDQVFGWDRGEGKRKPSPWPMQQIMEQYGFAPEQLLMVDDLTPGFRMAEACGVDFAFAGWGSPVPQVREFMKKHSTFFLHQVSGLEELLWV